MTEIRTRTESAGFVAATVALMLASDSPALAAPVAEEEASIAARTAGVVSRFTRTGVRRAARFMAAGLYRRPRRLSALPLARHIAADVL
jgi:hypothetical protein